jgi:hypothetical protein
VEVLRDLEESVRLEFLLIQALHDEADRLMRRAETPMFTIRERPATDMHDAGAVPCSEGGTLAQEAARSAT